MVYRLYAADGRLINSFHCPDRAVRIAREFAAGIRLDFDRGLVRITRGGATWKMVAPPSAEQVAGGCWT